MKRVLLFSVGFLLYRLAILERGELQKREMMRIETMRTKKQAHLDLLNTQAPLVVDMKEKR